jgi:hypothetical protein
MIKTFADLLLKLVEQESVVIGEAAIPHAPTIGSMYEGLTSDILSQMVPDGLDLSVVSGFIENSVGGISGQIDCMLVSGRGVPIPHTNLFRWHVRDVVAVFEVKKNLFSSELAGSHTHLRKVLDLHWQDLLHDRSGSLNVEAALHAFKMIVGFPPPPREQIESLPFDIEMIYRALTVELASPIRVAFGYSGFRSEKTLRDGFTSYLKDNLGKPGFSPSMLPNLIASGAYSLLKLNGLPYSGPMTENGWWPIIASSNENPLIFVLEIIWTRLSERAEMPEWFDADLGIERIVPLLSTRAIQRGELLGWEYDITDLSDADLGEIEAPVEWEPHFITLFQHTILSVLCNVDGIGLNDTLLSNLSRDETNELAELSKLRLIGQQADKLLLLTRQCRTLILPDGRFAAADDSSGRLSAWVQKYLAARR